MLAALPPPSAIAGLGPHREAVSGLLSEEECADLEMFLSIGEPHVKSGGITN